MNVRYRRLLLQSTTTPQDSRLVFLIVIWYAGNFTRRSGGRIGYITVGGANITSCLVGRISCLVGWISCSIVVVNICGGRRGGGIGSYAESFTRSNRGRGYIAIGGTNIASCLVGRKGCLVGWINCTVGFRSICGGSRRGCRRSVCGGRNVIGGLFERKRLFGGGLGVRWR